MDRLKAVLIYLRRHPWMASVIILAILSTSQFYVVEDQFCGVSERADAAKVDQVGQTYSYLLSLNEKQLKEPLNRFIILRLPLTEQEARRPASPPICNSPLVGESEPNPEPPERPDSISRLLGSVRKGQ